MIETPSYLFLREYFKIDHKELVNLTNHKSLLNYIIHNNLASKFRKFLVKNKYDKDLRILDHCISKNEDGKNFWDNSPNSHVERTCAITGRSYVNIIHPTDERVLNFRELMTLMGLPFDFQLIKRQKGGIPYNHICQNVPVNTAQYFVEQIVKFINNELEFSENNYLLQDNTNCNNWYENF